MTGRFLAHHKTFRTLSPPITKFRSLEVSGTLSTWCLFSAAAIDSPIITDLNNFLLSWSSDDNGSLTNLFLKA